MLVQVLPPEPAAAIRRLWFWWGEAAAVGPGLELVGASWDRMPVTARWCGLEAELGLEVL
ncbi:MAG: hypothetical protein ACRET5_07480 [Steroidobacteraceae bacterium]